MTLDWAPMLCRAWSKNIVPVFRPDSYPINLTEVVAAAAAAAEAEAEAEEATLAAVTSGGQR